MQVAAVILAAGASSRFGQPKQLVRLLLDRTIKAARGACSRVVLVTGAHRIERDDLEIAPNEQWQRGIGTSIRAGVRTVVDCDAVVLMTCDQPLVTQEHIQRLIDSGAEIAAADYSGTLGVPAFFARSQFANLLTLGDNEGAKKIIFANKSIVAKIPMPQAAIDIDTPRDFAKFSSEWTTSDSARQD
jgi:CTP:molybdopterin cytidylyltransferase MocA